MSDSTEGVIVRRAPRHNDWLAPEELAALTPETLVERTTALRGFVERHAADAERHRAPHDEVWAALRRAGVFYHFVPKAYGGLEFDIHAFIDAMLPISEGCAATGWVTAFCVEHNWLLAQFPKQAQDEIFGTQPYIIAPGATNPPGTAIKAPGGFRLSGHWKWGTGVVHADWALLAGLVQAEDQPPRVNFFILPAEQIRVLDTWRVDGLIGTGSHDIVVDDVFVPDHRSIDLEGMRAGRGQGYELHGNLVYRMPMTPFLGVTAAIPAVATARAAVGMLENRLKERMVWGTDQKHQDRPASQIKLGEADVRAKAAEALLRHVADRMVGLAASPDPITTLERVKLRAQIAHLVRLSREAVQIVADAAGSSAHFLANPIQRALRNLNVLSSHVLFEPDTSNELLGRALIGLPPNSSMY